MIDFAGPDQLVVVTETKESLAKEKAKDKWSLNLWDLTTGKMVYRPIPFASLAMYKARGISPGGRYLAVFEPRGILLFDLSKGTIPGACACRINKGIRSGWSFRLTARNWHTCMASGPPRAAGHHHLGHLRPGHRQSHQEAHFPAGSRPRAGGAIRTARSSGHRTKAACWFAAVTSLTMRPARLSGTQGNLLRGFGTVASWGTTMWPWL